MKDKIESSEQSVIKLKRHMENGTCPPDLRYDAKANIFPDEDFKSDIKAIRKEAEQKFLGALIRFHDRRIDRNQAQLRKAKSCIKNTSVKAGKSQSWLWSIVTLSIHTSCLLFEFSVWVLYSRVWITITKNAKIKTQKVNGFRDVQRDVFNRMQACPAGVTGCD